MSSIHDTLAKLAVDVAELERANRELEATVARLGEQNSELCDDLEALRGPARKAGLSAAAAQALAMAARYRDEGDMLDSIRIQACLSRALDAMAAAGREAA